MGWNDSFTPLVPNVTFLYHLEKLKNLMVFWNWKTLRFSDLFRRCRNVTTEINGLKTACLFERIEHSELLFKTLRRQFLFWEILVYLGEVSFKVAYLSELSQERKSWITHRWRALYLRQCGITHHWRALYLRQCSFTENAKSDDLKLISCV